MALRHTRFRNCSRWGGGRCKWGDVPVHFSLRIPPHGMTTKLDAAWIDFLWESHRWLLVRTLAESEKPAHSRYKASAYGLACKWWPKCRRQVRQYVSSTMRRRRDAPMRNGATKEWQEWGSWCCPWCGQAIACKHTPLTFCQQVFRACFIAGCQTPQELFLEPLSSAVRKWPRKTSAY